jgi:hypothetical protein
MPEAGAGAAAKRRGHGRQAAIAFGMTGADRSAVAHLQAHRPHARVAEVADGGRVGHRQQGGQRARELGQQLLAGVLALGDGVDGADHGVTHQLGAERIALLLALGGGALARLAAAAGLGQHGGHVGIELAQLPLAGAGDLHGKAVGGDLRLDLLVLDQAQRIPAGGLGGQRLQRCVVAPRTQLPKHALVERVVEGQREDGRLAVELELCGQQAVALENAGGRQRGQAQALDRALAGFAGRELEPLDGGFQRRGQAVDRVGLHRYANGPPCAAR